MAETKPRRKYEPLKDARRYCDGVRLHELVGVILTMGWDLLRGQNPKSKLSPMEFSRCAIPLLGELGLIALVDPTVCIPEWLDERSRKLARRGHMQPIWMPTEDLSFDVWTSVEMSIHATGELTLEPTGALLRKRRLN